MRAGFHEIVLTGIHLGAYGRDLGGNVTLADACREVLSVAGLRRLRLGSLESLELSPELFALIRGDERFSARALDIDDQGGLVIETDAGAQTVRSGEISIRWEEEQ